jgi:putative lipoic acid-binding regulatory protein
LNALLKFPVTYTFHVVGKTSGNVTIQELFVEEVKRTIVQSSSTPIFMDNQDDDDDVHYEITARGSKYTKVSIRKEVINAEEITFIYDQLSNLELCVMQF